MEQAWRWMRYFLFPHAVHFYTGMNSQSAEYEHLRKFGEYLLARDPVAEVRPGYLTSKWTYYQRNLAGPNKSKERKEFWDALVTHGWLKPVPHDSRTQPIALAYLVNPKVYDGRFDEHRAKAQRQAENHRLTMHEDMKKKRD